jgi:hypothetical protein
MTQVSMKTALKKWGKAAEQAITIKLNQLHWRNSALGLLANLKETREVK